MTGFFFSSRRRHTRLQGDWSSDVCSSDLVIGNRGRLRADLEIGEGRPVSRRDYNTRVERAARVVRLLQLPEQRGHLRAVEPLQDRKSTRLNSSHLVISYAVFCLKKKKKK